MSTATNFSEKKNKILRIQSDAERDIAIATWGMEFIGDYSYKHPPVKPQAILEYYSQSEEERKAMNRNPNNYPKFWNNPEVKKYFEDEDKLAHLNYRNRRFLSWMKEVLPAEEMRINKALGSYPNGIEEVVWND